MSRHALALEACGYSLRDLGQRVLRDCECDSAVFLRAGSVCVRCGVGQRKKKAETLQLEGSPAPLEFAMQCGTVSHTYELQQ